MEKIKDFLVKYRGAIIGGIIAIVLLILRIHEILIGILIIAAGAFAGNFVQKNKEIVKEGIRHIVDRW